MWYAVHGQQEVPWPALLVQVSMYVRETNIECPVLLNHVVPPLRHLDLSERADISLICSPLLHSQASPGTISYASAVLVISTYFQTMSINAFQLLDPYHPPNRHGALLLNVMAIFSFECSKLSLHLAATMEKDDAEWSNPCLWAEMNITKVKTSKFSPPRYSSSWCISERVAFHSTNCRILRHRTNLHKLADCRPTTEPYVDADLPHTSPLPMTRMSKLEASEPCKNHPKRQHHPTLGHNEQQIEEIIKF